jgi:hypothetical protein
MGLLAISGWLVAAVLAVGISWSAIGVVRDSVGASQPVATALPVPNETSAPAPAPSSTRPTAVPTAGALAVGKGLGGTVTAQCVKGRPNVVSAVPRQGFGVESGGSSAEFRSSDHRTEMTVTCSGLTATVHVEERASGGGGGGGRGGSGRGGGGDG